MTEEIDPRLTIQDIFGYVLAYAFWLLTASIAMVTLLVMRSTLNIVWPLLGGSRWVLRPVDRFGLVLLGLVWLVYVIFIEQHYRASITEVRLRRVRLRVRPALSTVNARLDVGTRALRRLGLDILVQRLIPTIAGPVSLLLLSYVIEQLTILLMTA